MLASRFGSASYYLTRIAHSLLRVSQANPYTPALMGNLDAGIAIAQLPRLQQILTARTRVADLYAVALRDMPSVKMPQYAAGRFLSRFFVEFLDQNTASMVRRGLLDRKISTRAAYPQWSENGGNTVDSFLADRLVELPSRLHMTETDIAEIASAIDKIILLE